MILLLAVCPSAAFVLGLWEYCLVRDRACCVVLPHCLAALYSAESRVCMKSTHVPHHCFASCSVVRPSWAHHDLLV